MALVQKGFRYSNEEQWTGNYWIDGKKIYCKIVYLLPPFVVGVEQNRAFDMLNIFEFLPFSSFSFYRVNSSGGFSFWPVGVPSSNLGSVLYARISSSFISYFIGSSFNVVDLESIRYVLFYTCSDR